MPTKKQEAGYEKTFPKRMKIWRHNALLGQVRRAQITGNAVQDAETTTPKAKQMGHDISMIASLLLTELKNRID